MIKALKNPHHDHGIYRHEQLLERTSNGTTRDQYVLHETGQQMSLEHPQTPFLLTLNCRQTPSACHPKLEYFPELPGQVLEATPTSLQLGS